MPRILGMSNDAGLMCCMSENGRRRLKSRFNVGLSLVSDQFIVAFIHSYTHGWNVNVFP